MKRLILLVALALGSTAHADDTTARKACTDAMNADPAFAESIIATADQDLATRIHNYNITFSKLQEDAADKIARNEKHVLLAYVAIWLAAAGFVIFLWKRQQSLKDQIVRLQKDLELAMKDDATPDTPAAGAAKAKTKKS